MVEFKDDKAMKEEEKTKNIQVSKSQSIESSEFKHTKSLKMIKEVKENLVQEIILVSKEKSNVGPIRTSSSNPSESNRYTNSEPDNIVSSHHHPYAWWGHPLYMNHQGMYSTNFGREMGVGRWPRPSRGIASYPRGAFGWYMDRPFWN